MSIDCFVCPCKVGQTFLFSLLLRGTSMKRLKLQCHPLDQLLGGGIENQTITEIYGEAGSVKTNFCLQASRECTVGNKKVVYIDTDGVSLERLKQISKGYDYNKILSNILFFTPSSFEEQEKMLAQATGIKDVELIVVDTFNMFYRIKLEDDEEGAVRSLNRQLTALQLAARELGFYVILSGQVYTAENGEIKPFAGRGIEHMAKTILRLEKIGPGKRQATIIKHRSQPEGKKEVFTIETTGLT
jgi:DNA repair protein RadB